MSHSDRFPPWAKPDARPDYVKNDPFWQAWLEWRMLCRKRYKMAFAVRWSPITEKVVNLP